MRKILVSRCLLGELCRWDGKRLEYDIVDLLAGSEPLGVCPEMEGGLPCPRPKAQIIDGDGNDVLDGHSRVTNADGRDVTLFFLEGAKAAAKLALEYDIKQAIFKEKSPSCGVSRIYRNGGLSEGIGVTAALLKRHGLEIIGYGA